MHTTGVLVMLACTVALCAAVPGKGGSVQGWTDMGNGMMNGMDVMTWWLICR